VKRRRLAQAAAALTFPLSIVVALFLVRFPDNCPSFDCGDHDSGEFLQSGFTRTQILVVALGLLISFGIAAYIRVRGRPR
jgi:hypothetical protein